MPRVLAWLCLLFASAATVRAFSNGAPNSACGNQIPQHSDNPRSDTGGYFTASPSYTCALYGGQRLNITYGFTVIGFRGVMSSVYSGAARRGSWPTLTTVSSPFKIVCGQAYCHSNPDIKLAYDMPWAPIFTEPCNEGTYTVRTSIVQSLSVIYLITSSMPEDIYGGVGAGRLFAANDCPGGMDFPVACEECGLLILGLPTYVSWEVGTCYANDPAALCVAGMAGYTIYNDTAYACTQTLSEFVCYGHGVLSSATPRYFNDVSGNCTCNAGYSGARCDNCTANYFQVNGTCLFNGTVSSSTGMASSTGSALSSTGVASSSTGVSSTGAAGSSTGTVVSSTGAASSSTGVSSTGSGNSSVCVPNPCRHGGECTVDEDDGEPDCDCRRGWHGSRCQFRDDDDGVDIVFDFGPDQVPAPIFAPPLPPPPLPPPADDPAFSPRACTPNPCNNNGRCVRAETAEGYLCVCAVGFAGALCTDRIPCGGPCLHRGICNDVTQRCECNAPWIGDRCEQPDNRAVCEAFGHCRAGRTCVPALPSWVDDSDVAPFAPGMDAMCK